MRSSLGAVLRTRRAYLLTYSYTYICLLLDTTSQDGPGRDVVHETKRMFEMEGFSIVPSHLLLTLADMGVRDTATVVGTHFEETKHCEEGC